LQSEVQASAAKVYLWQKQQVLNENLKQNKRSVVESIIYAIVGNIFAECTNNYFYFVIGYLKFD